MNPMQIAATVRQRDRLLREVVELRAEVLRLQSIVAASLVSDADIDQYLTLTDAKAMAARLRESPEVTARRRAELMKGVA
jgi:hypothetical protein